MSFEICMSSKELGKQYFFFGNSSAIEGVREWIRTLPDKPFIKLHIFGNKLSVKNTMEFASELELAMKHSRPPSGTLETLEQLAKNIGLGDEDETMYIEEA